MWMKELWTGRVEVLTPPTEFGDTRAFTNVVTWASNAEEYKTHVANVFEKYGWVLLGIEESYPVAKFIIDDDEMLDAFERASGNPDACIYLTFHYYPSKLC
jgi:hypothetical protein